MKSLLLSTVAILTPCVAFAQIAAPATNSWSPDIQNALNIVLLASAGAIASVITAAGVKWAKKLGVEVTAQNKANMEADLNAALKVGITSFLPMIEQKGWNSPEVRDAILSAATAYLRQRFPDRAASITAAAQPASAYDPKVSSTAAIGQTLAARLPDAVSVAAASPATPAVTQAPGTTTAAGPRA
jgi:hypothetical protein